MREPDTHPDAASVTPPDAPSYEENVAQLEAIVRDIESKQLTLAQQVEAYEAGIALVAAIERMLDATEARVLALQGEDTVEMEGLA